MPSVDLDLDELHNYQPVAEPPSDLDAFWADVITDALDAPLDTVLSASDGDLSGVDAFALSFAGADNGRVSGWYVRPSSGGPHPGLLQLHGYSRRAARPLDLYLLAAHGIAVLSMDCRAQAGDSEALPVSGPSASWLTSGLSDPASHYYTRVYGDALRAIEVLASFDEVDSSRLGCTGVSQGGGLTIAVAALSARPCAAWADIPFLCDFPRGVQMATKPPYTEIADLLRARPDLEHQAFATLAYVDAANLAPRVSCPIVLTAGLWDDICPPSTIFGTFRRLGSADKELRTMSFHRHELSYEIEEQRFHWLRERLGA